MKVYTDDKMNRLASCVSEFNALTVEQQREAVEEIKQELNNRGVDLLPFFDAFVVN